MEHTFSHIEIIENLKLHLLPYFNDLNEFDRLFPENELQMELYNEIAPNFFIQVNKMYFERFILAISRLLDPAKQSTNQNLSIYQLIEIANKTYYPEVENLKKTIEQIKVEAEDIRDFRSKFIAHRDLPRTLNSDWSVEPIEFEKMKEIFHKLARCVNQIEAHLKMPETSFIWTTDRFGATALLRYLKFSVIYRDMRLDTDKWEEDEERAKKSKFYNL